MTPSVLIDLERLRYPYSGVGYYCLCLEMGLRSLEGLPMALNYYKAGGREASQERAFSPLHYLYNPTTSGYGVLHVTHQLQRYFLRSARPNGQKRVLTLHDLNFLYEDLRPEARRRRLALVRHNVARASVIVCISQFVADCLAQNAQLVGLRPEQRIEVIHNGIIFDEGCGVSSERTKPLETLNYLLAIGVLQDKKQQHLLLEMLVHLPEDLHLVLMYSGAHEGYRARLERLIEEYQLWGRVHWFASATPHEKQCLLARCTALVHPSIAEGFGIPPIEAMALGKPVFLAHATSLPEVGGAEAYYFTDSRPQRMAVDVLEGLGGFTSDVTKPERLIRWAQRYDYRAMAARYAELYQSLV